MADDENQNEPEKIPPGHFISDELRAQTARFLDELKTRLSRRESESEPKLGPPRK